MSDTYGLDDRFEKDQDGNTIVVAKVGDYNFTSEEVFNRRLINREASASHHQERKDNGNQRTNTRQPSKV